MFKMLFYFLIEKLIVLFCWMILVLLIRIFKYLKCVCVFEMMFVMWFILERLVLIMRDFWLSEVIVLIVLVGEDWLIRYRLVLVLVSVIVIFWFNLVLVLVIRVVLFLRLNGWFINFLCCMCLIDFDGSSIRMLGYFLKSWWFCCFDSW